MTAAERQQRKRDRAKAGLVLVQAWIPAAARQAVETAITEAVASFKGETT
jgi:hypothetical protein